MKIAMFGHKKIPSREGGIEVVVEEISKRMVGRGHDVICYNRKKHRINGKNLNYTARVYKGIVVKNVITLDKRGMAAVTSSFFASILCGISNYDIVHIHAEGPAFFSFIPKIFGKKVVVTIHGLDWERSKWSNFASWYIKQGEKNAVKYADEIIVLSEKTKNYFTENYGRITTYIPNGVNEPQNRKADLIREWQLEKDNYFLFLGRIVPEKGLKYLVEAWGQINTTKKLVIAGGSSDSDSFFDEIKSINKEIIFTGFVEGKMLDELYSNAYVYILPSDVEGMPLSLLESMSYGNCCLVSNIPECKSVVGDYGITFKAGDINSLVDKIQYLNDNPEIVDAFKKKSKKYILNKYNWDDVVDKTLNVYRNKSI